MRLFKLFSPFPLLMTLIVLSAATGEALGQTAERQFYVAKDGNDGNAGTRERPFATLGRAREEVRKIKASGLRSDLTVFLRGGRYEFSEPFVLNAEDSGDERHSITYAAYPGERVEICGGQRIAGWRKGEGNLWIADVPGVKEGKWYFRQLFIGGERRQRARTPNVGYYGVDGVISLDNQAQFKYKSEDIQKAWADEGSAEVVALLAWAEARLPVKAVDEAKHTVTLAGKVFPYNREKNARYWVENSLSILDAPGEWFLDRRTGTLSYMPMQDEDVSKVEVIAPVLEELVRIDGGTEGKGVVSNLHLRGFIFCHTDWSAPQTGYTNLQAAYDVGAAVVANGARGCSIENSTFAHLGKHGIELAKGCRNNRIAGNEMYDIGGGGVKIGYAFGYEQLEDTAQAKPGDASKIHPQPPEELTRQGVLTGGNLVTDNHIYNAGRVYPGASGVWIGQSDNNTIAHNHLHDIAYLGISAGWTWGYTATLAKANLIEYNHVHHIGGGGGMISDLSGIYTLGVQPGTVIRNNLIHDIDRYAYGGWGIYLDEGSSGILVENNIIHRVRDGGFHQHYGQGNTIRNNIFALGVESQLRKSRYEQHVGFTFEKNIVYWNQGLLFNGKVVSSPAFDNNLYFDARGGPVRFGSMAFEEWQKLGQDKHSIVADPLFADPSSGDFTLRPGSPALKIGFKPIDLSRVGPTKPTGVRLNAR